MSWPRDRARRWAHAVMASRPPDFTLVREDGSVYLQRWWAWRRNPGCNLYVHRFLGSDDDAALHDHMYANLTWVLEGGYWEHFANRRLPLWRAPGRVVFRAPSTAHRVELQPGVDAPRPAISLFLTGPRVRQWGFHCPRGWRH